MALDQDFSLFGIMRSEDHVSFFHNRVMIYSCKIPKNLQPTGQARRLIFSLEGKPIIDSNITSVASLIVDFVHVYRPHNRETKK